MDGWTTAWLLWGAFFVVVEFRAIKNSTAGDTLSEKIWKWFEIEERDSNWTGKRVVLVAGLVWLLAHLGFRVI